MHSSIIFVIGASINVLFILSIPHSTEAVHYEANWKSIDSRPLPEWYDKAKVGIFLHWGVYSVPSYGGEWFWANWQEKQSKYVNFMRTNYAPNFTYADFAPMFTAEFFSPRQWAQLFKKAGARYVVLTSKHHEGYTLWPSKFSFNWNAKDVGSHRDLVGELAEAVRAENLTFGLYHSLLEWYNPMYLEDKKNQFKTNEFVRYKVRPEMEELVNVYKPSIIWSDGDWEAEDTYWNSTDFLAWLYNDSPVKNEVVVNDRWGKGTPCKHGGVMNCDDRYMPNTLQPRKWENAMTVDKSSWGYRREAQLNDYKTTDELVAALAQTIALGGNILINVGPTRDGRIVPFFQERLTELGQWLTVNSEAIYESASWRHQNDTTTKGVWYTQNNGKVYAIVLEYPSNDEVTLGSIEFSNVKSVSLLGHDQNEINFKAGPKQQVVIEFPKLTPLMPIRHAYVFRFTLKSI